MSDEEAFVFLIPEVEPTVVAEESDVALRAPGFLRHQEVSVSRDQVESFWTGKVVALTETIAKAQAANETEGFRVDEISFSIGVSAKGGVFFVAEGSVEASMSVTLRRAG